MLRIFGEIESHLRLQAYQKMSSALFASCYPARTALRPLQSIRGAARGINHGPFLSIRSMALTAEAVIAIVGVVVALTPSMAILLAR